MNYVPYDNDEQTPILNRTEKMQLINKLRKLKAKIDNDLTKAVNACGHVCVDLDGQPTKKIKHLQTMANEILEMDPEISDADLVATMNFLIQDINRFADTKRTGYNNSRSSK